MSLCRRPPGQSVIFDKSSDILPLQFSPLHAKRCDHFIIRLRHISGAGRFCDVGILHFRRVFINIGDLQSHTVKRICDHACVVFFVSALPSRNEERLLERLCEAVENIKRLSVEPYTREDICDLIVKFLEDHGTRVSEEESFRKELQETVVSLDIMCVNEAAAAVEELVFYADFSGFVPAVDARSLKLLTESRKKGRVRRDVK